MSLTLRDYLSHEWQDVGAVSSAVYKALGVKINPERLASKLASAFPDVEVDGILIRLRASAGNPSDSTEQRHQERREQRERRRA